MLGLATTTPAAVIYPGSGGGSGGSVSSTNLTGQALVQSTNIAAYQAALMQERTEITLSAKGILNGLSATNNDGAMFGPDTPGTTTCGIQEAWYSINKGTEYGPRNVAVSLRFGDGNFFYTNCLVFSNNYTTSIRMEGNDLLSTRLVFAGTAGNTNTIWIRGGGNANTDDSNPALNLPMHFWARHLAFSSILENTNVLVCVTNVSGFQFDQCRFVSWRSMTNNTSGSAVSVASVGNYPGPQGLVGVVAGNVNDHWGIFTSCSWQGLASGGYLFTDHLMIDGAKFAEVGTVGGLFENNLFPNTSPFSLGAGIIRNSGLDTHITDAHFYSTRIGIAALNFSGVTTPDSLILDGFQTEGATYDLVAFNTNGIAVYLKDPRIDYSFAKVSTNGAGVFSLAPSALDVKTVLYGTGALTSPSTNLNANAITSGTVSEARLPGKFLWNTNAVDGTITNINGGGVSVGTGLEFIQVPTEGAVAFYLMDTGRVAGVEMRQWNVTNRNTSVGSEALESNAGGYDNSAFGDDALQSVTTGLRNTAVGSGAGQTLTTAQDNTVLGVDALQTATDGSYNVAIGVYALKQLTSGNNNIAIGVHNSQENLTGADNVAVGMQALQTGWLGSRNVALGKSALNANTNATGRNTAVGYRASGSSSNTTGTVTLGYQAGYSLQRDNTLVIHNDDVATPLLYGEFDTGALIIGGHTTNKGALMFLPDSTYPIGASASGRPSAITSAGNVTVGSSASFIVGSRGRLSAGADGVFRFLNNATTASGNLQVGSLIADATVTATNGLFLPQLSGIPSVDIRSSSGNTNWLVFNLGGDLYAIKTNAAAASSYITNKLTGLDLLSSKVVLGSAVSLTTDTAANVTSLSLGSGDWMVSGNVNFINGGGTTLSGSITSIGTTSATLATDGTESYRGPGVANWNYEGVTVTPVKITGPATVYLVTKATFTISTCSAFGSINAEQVR